MKDNDSISGRFDFEDNSIIEIGIHSTDDGIPGSWKPAEGILEQCVPMMEDISRRGILELESYFGTKGYIDFADEVRDRFRMVMLLTSMIAGYDEGKVFLTEFGKEIVGKIHSSEKEELVDYMNGKIDLLNSEIMLDNYLRMLEGIRFCILTEELKEHLARIEANKDRKE